MLRLLNIRDIIIDGYRAIGNKNWKFIIFVFWLFPILIAGLLWHWGCCIPTDITSDVISGIGLFAGLMFTLLFIVTTNYKTRKQQLLKNENDEEQSYLQRYYQFTQCAVALISYSIVKAGIIILLTIIYNSLSSLEVYNLPISVVSSLLTIFWIQFIIIIVRILKEMYTMLYDDIEK